MVTGSLCAKKKNSAIPGDKNATSPCFFHLFWGQKWPTLGAAQSRFDMFVSFFCGAVEITPRIDGMPIFVAVGVDFVSIPHPDAVFCPFSGKNRGRKKKKKGKKLGKKKGGVEQARTRYVLHVRSARNHLVG